MLITISGMVGSGKSTTADVMMDSLSGAGLKPQYLRFRYLGLLGFSRTGRSQPDPQDGAERSGQRGRGFALRQLTPALALGYAGRILAFRFSRIGNPSRCDILDRYFYDNFVHYRLTSKAERFYAWVLRQLIPRPDAAILLVASDETISSRRPNYANEYVVTVGRQYLQLEKLFPHLIPIRTDAGSSAHDQIRRIAESLTAGGRRSSRS